MGPLAKKKIGGSFSATVGPNTQDPHVVDPQTQADRVSQDNPDIGVEPVHENEPVHAHEPMAMEEPALGEKQATSDDPTRHVYPSSPARTSIPVQEVNNIVSSHTIHDAEVTIIGEAHKARETSTALAKVLAKDEPVMTSKGKTKL